MTKWSNQRFFSIAAVAVASVLVLTGCSSTADNQTQDQNTTDSAPLFDALPEQIRAAGKIAVGMDTSGMPYASEKDGEFIGIDPELAELLEPVLGVDLEITNVVFAEGVTSLRTGRVDMFWTFSKDRPEAREQVDFVDFALTGTGMLVAEGNPKGIGGMSDLCGMTAAVQSGSSNVEITQRFSDDCLASSEKAIELLQFPSAAATLLQVQQGRADAMVTGFPLAAYEANTSDDYELAGEVVDPLFAGITFDKDNHELVRAVQQAMQYIIDDGSYGVVFEEWGMSDLMVETSTINAGEGL